VKESGSEKRKKRKHLEIRQKKKSVKEEEAGGSEQIS